MYDYNQTYNLMKKFSELSTNEIRIMDYLMQTDVSELTYSELTEAIGLDKRKMVSNVRKAIIHLQELKIVCIVNKDTNSDCKAVYSPMKACFIVDGWMDNLLNSGI